MNHIKTCVLIALTILAGCKKDKNNDPVPIEPEQSLLPTSVTRIFNMANPIVYDTALYQYDAQGRCIDYKDAATHSQTTYNGNIASQVEYYSNGSRAEMTYWMKNGTMPDSVLKTTFDNTNTITQQAIYIYHYNTAQRADTIWVYDRLASGNLLEVSEYLWIYNNLASETTYDYPMGSGNVTAYHTTCPIAPIQKLLG